MDDYEVVKALLFRRPLHRVPAAIWLAVYVARVTVVAPQINQLVLVVPEERFGAEMRQHAPCGTRQFSAREKLREESKGRARGERCES